MNCLTWLITCVAELCSSQSADIRNKEVMGEETQSEVESNFDGDGRTGESLRTTELGSQSVEQGRVISGVQTVAMRDSVIWALVIARAVEFCNRSEPSKSSSSAELTGQERGSSGQIEDPGSGSYGETVTKESETRSESVYLSQIVPREESATSRETGESSRGERKERESVRLVTCWFSPFAHRVAISLREKGVEYVVIEESTLNKNDRTLNANPLSKRIPILMHRGRVVSESRIIMEYIDEAWPDSPCSLLPVDPFERSAARYWSDYIDKKISTRLLQHIGVNVKEVYDTINDALIGLNKAMTVISHGKSFFMGDRLGFVDITFAPMIPWLQVLQKLDNYNIPDSKMCPRLHEWLSALQKHPSVRPSLEEASPTKLRTFIVTHFRDSQK